MLESATIKSIYRYPLKGFSGERLASADLKAGETLPFDRAFAIENGPSGFNSAVPKYLAKVRFLMLMRNERIANLSSNFSPQTGLLTIQKKNQLCIQGNLFDAKGRAAIEAWIAEEFAGELRGRPRILTASGHSFSDTEHKVLHLINLASVRALEQKLARPIDPMRFRANIIVDGAPPFGELEWVGRHLALPGATLAVLDRTGRCAATNVDPVTGSRDMQLPGQLKSIYGHSDFGIYVSATGAGGIATGDPVSIMRASR